MQLKMPQKDMVSLLDRVRHAAVKRGPMPALQCVLIDARDELVTFTCSDLYVSLHATVTAHVPNPGRALVDVDALLSRVKALPAGDVTIDADDGKCVLTGIGSRRYRLPALHADDYPALPQPEERIVASVDPKMFRATLDRVRYAISPDESRPALASALFSIGSGELKAVATDGHRLSVSSCSADQTRAEDLLVSARGVTCIVSILDGAQDAITIAHDVNSPRILVGSGALSCSIKLVDAAFPPYVQVVPNKTEACFTVNRHALLSAVKAVSLGSGGGGIVFCVDGSTCELTAQSAENGDAHDEVDIENDSKKKSKFGLSAKYVIDTIGALDSDAVRFGYGGDLDPVKIEEDVAPGFVGVIMPMRI